MCNELTRQIKEKGWRIDSSYSSREILCLLGLYGKIDGFKTIITIDGKDYPTEREVDGEKVYYDFTYMVDKDNMSHLVYRDIFDNIFDVIEDFDRLSVNYIKEE